MKKRIPALVLSCFIVFSCFTGCSEKPETSTIINQPADVTEKVFAPAVTYAANLGENFKYETGNLDIKFVEVSQTAQDPDSQGNYSYALLFTAVNNSDEIKNVHMLDDFSIEIDGQVFKDQDLFSALSAANAAMIYQGYERYDAELEPGETVTGFVPFKIEGEWESMKVMYKPDSENSKDYIIYEISKDDVVKKYE